MNPLGQIVSETLAPVATDSPYALIDYPNYLNPGDCAIWLGARRVLERLNGSPPAYVSTLRGFSAGRCRARIGDGTIFLLGGGNFGDLYLRHHEARLRCLEAVPGNPVVLLPISTARNANPDAALVERTRRALGARTTVFVREKRSLRDLQDTMGLDCRLCPDLVHGLDFDVIPAVRDVLCLLRTDIEARTARPEGSTAAVDWTDLAGLKAWNRAGKLALAVNGSLAMHDWIAGRKLRLAGELVRSARVVITDRLHGLLLAHGTGRKVVILDNATGKLSSYLDTWREELAGTEEAQDLAEALAIAGKWQSASA